MASMRKPLSQAFLPENRLSRAPTTNSAAPEIAAATATPLAVPNRNGMSGRARAPGEGDEGRTRRAGRRAEIVGVEAKLLARQRVERLFRVGNQVGGDVAGFSERDAAGGVDQRELLGLLLGIALKPLALLRDLMLDRSTDVMGQGLQGGANSSG
jgi:hypothetical protein